MTKKARNKEIAYKYNSGLTMKEIAEQYNISIPAVWGVINRTKIIQRSVSMKFYSPDTIRCLKCGCTAYQKGGVNKIGKRMYICKKCKSSFVAPDERTRQTHKTKCIYCNGESVKWGIDTLGKQKYRCKKCKRFFITEYVKYPKIPKPIVDKVVLYLNVNKLRLKDIAKMTGVSPAKVSRIKADLKKAS